MSAPAQIARAVPGDADLIAHCLDDPANWDRLASYSRAQILTAITDPEQILRIWRAEVGAAFDGALGFAWLRRDGPGRVKLEEFAMLRPGQGHGGAFFRALLADLAQAEAISELWLNVAGDNAGAIRFYRRFGFQEQSLAPAAWPRRRGLPADVLRMGRALTR